MHIRYLKIMVAVIAGLMALFYVLQNFANIDQAHGALMYVMSGVDHTVYPATIAFKSASPEMAWAALALVFTGELLAGLLLFKGAIDMWGKRSATPDAFQSAKKWAEIGAGIGILVWFGFFGVIGAAFFQMWQTATGTASMNGAFQYFISCAFALMFIHQKDD